MQCPKCGNETCEIITEKHSSGSDYSLGSGLCGMALFGPLGSACGWTDGKTTTVDAYWKCPKCGYKFKA